MTGKLRIWAAVTAATLVIAACGGSEGDGGEAVDCQLDQVDGDISFYNWSEYIDPELVTAFQEEYGVTVTSDFYESNEAMLAQLQSGAVYDMIVPSDYMIGIMIQEELLLPIDTDAVPNLENLGDRFRELPYDPGPGYSAAYQYGTTGLGVNTELVGTDFEPSWSLLFDPELTGDFAGGVSVLNDPREAMGAALMYLGYELNDNDIEHLGEARDVIIAAKDGIATFDSDQYDEALVNGEVAVSHGYSGNMIIGIGEAENPDQFEYVLPQEGATFWIDNMAIPTTADNPCTAFTFMNYLLDAENGATLTNWNYYGSPNQTAIDDGLIDQEVVDFYAATETAEDLQIIEDTGDYEINFTDYFAEAKS
jgi:spermidine/putrescine-binding protein